MNRLLDKTKSAADRITIKKSARRKYKLSPSEQMDVEVKDRLASVIIRIDDDTITVISKTMPACDLRRRNQ